MENSRTSCVNLCLSYGLNICVSTNSYIKDLTLNVMKPLGGNYG